jgi:methionine-rich copper-binding protein CopC
MNRSALLAMTALALLAATVLQGCGSQPRASTRAGAPAVTAPETTQPESTAPPVPFQQERFVNRRVINYVSSDPANNALLTTPPQEVIIYFSKGLGAGSFIDVTREGVTAVAGPVVTAPDTRSMSVPVAAGLTGNYKVKYAAYFASGYYEEGSFGFSVQVP